MKDSKIGVDFTLKLMSRLNFFDRFSPSERADLVKFHQHYVVYSAGETVIEEGTHEDSFFIVLSGSAVVTTGTRTNTIAKVAPGDIVGEIAFLTKRPRSATVIAEKEFIVIKVDETMLKHLEAKTREKFKDIFIEKLIDRLYVMNDLSEGSLM